MFGRLDNENGEVCCVYSDHKCLRTKSVPDHTKMNVEHTWPQSKGAVGDAKSDLHHLYPADSKVNSTRSNFPFCEVSSLKWQNKVSKQGKNKWGENCFEPPAGHKGNVARASFYFAIKYGKQIDEHEEKILREWNKEDPVDQDEVDRNRVIYNYQGNSNVFVEHPEFVDQIKNF
ncbi:endonuclease I family protein [Bacteriovorax sp. Seq25_V]|uniref:endonuclease I family protein n=1 Tax=Bacteriovorax sp. Seq25_V TaxID=1201288 RepID=UPI00350F1455